MKTVCPICKNTKIEGTITLHNIPYFENFLCESELQAKQCGCGTQSMAQCQYCGFVFNRAFKPQNVIYGSGYHAERGASKYYMQHLKYIAGWIDSTASIRGKRILEVACGTGEFLQVIADHKPTACIGVDPSADEAQENCMIRCTLFDEAYLKQYPEPIDILISRHMIEHIENPLEMLRLFAQALPENGVLYLETPRLDWIFENHVFYDFTYEHCSYFTDEFMGRLLFAAGFSILKMEPSFEGQFFSILARKDGDFAEISPVSLETLDRVRANFAETREFYFAAKERFSSHSIWTDTVHKGVPPLCNSLYVSDVYLWGAAGKGVMCCNLLGGKHIIGCIDKNPFKQGKFIPGTGHMVLAPSEISYEKVKCVLVENDIYFEEIEKEVHTIDERIQVFSLNKLLGLTIR